MKRSLAMGLGLALAALSVGGAEIKVEKPYFRWLFGGFGFQHSEANLEALMTDEFRDQRVLKTFAEISPTFGRVYTGFADQSREQMDRFAAYYHKTFAKAGTALYAVPCALPARAEDEDPNPYAEKVAANLAYLVKERNCRLIKFYCLSNELMTGNRWGWFDGTNKVDGTYRMELFKKWNVALYDAFRQAGLDIALIGSDKAVTQKPEAALPVQEWTAKNMDEWLGAYVTHWYVYGFPVGQLDLWDRYRAHFNDHVQLALRKHKRYILGEFGFCPVFGKTGVMVDDVGFALRQPETAAEAVLCKCEVGLAAMNAGAYGCVSWSFVDYPDPFTIDNGHSAAERAAYEAGRCGYRLDLKYNKWGLFHWSDVERDWSATPELYAVGYLAKLFRKNATVLVCTSDDALLRSGAVINPDQSVSIAIVNRGAAREVTVDCSSWANGPKFSTFAKPARRYVYEAAKPPLNAFNDLQPPADTVAAKGGRLTVTLPAKSVTFLTTDYRDATPAKVTGVEIVDGTLRWRASASADHRYYRVYRDGAQVASTVATSCPVADVKATYAVRSVDRWGNVGAAGATGH